MADTEDKKLKREKSPCCFVAKTGKNKGKECGRMAWTKIIVDGVEQIVCYQHNPKYKEQQAANKRARLAKKRNETAGYVDLGRPRDEVEDLEEAEDSER